MGLAIGKSTLTQNMSYPEPGVDNSAPTPGKRTLTEQLAAQVHNQVKDACTDDKGAGCFLSAEDRKALNDQIDHRIAAAAVNWSQALTNSRITVLAKHKDGWGALWKIGATIALAGITEGASAGLEFLAEAAETVTAAQLTARLVNHEEAVHGVLDFAGEQVAEMTKEQVNEHANETGNEQADFLVKQLNAPQTWSITLMESYKRGLDDYGRILLHGLVDPRTVMTVDAFTRQVNALLARFDKNVGAIGDPAGPMRSQTAAWIYPRGGGKPRLAIVVAGFLDGGWGQKDRWLPEAFVRWVDADMVDYAVDKLNESQMAARGPTHLADLVGAPTDPETQAWDHGGAEAPDEMWPDFGKQRSAP